MLDRCYSDVDNNYMTFLKLSQEARMYDSGPFLWLEQEVAKVISKQSKRGHAFNRPLAEWLLGKLEEWLGDIDEALAVIMKSKPVMKNLPVKRIRAKNGDYSSPVYTWFYEEFEEDRRYGPKQPHRAFSVEAGLCDEENPEAFCRVDWPAPNFGSNEQMLKHLLAFGWEPLEFTKKGNPKITEESMELLLKKEGVDPVLRQLVKRRVVAHRYGMVKGWLERIGEDGRIRGEVNPQGAVTLRMTHKVVVNVPKYDPAERYSEFYRACFCSTYLQEGDPEYDLEWTFERENKRTGEIEVVNATGRMAQIGCDASGIENRMLAHYLNDPALTEKIIEDFHQMLFEALGHYMNSRGNTKNWEYAFFYGAQDLKLGTMLDNLDVITEDEALAEGWYQIQRGPNKDKWKAGQGRPLEWRLVKYVINGKRSRDVISSQIPELGELIDWVVEESRQGYVTSFDGRRLIMRRGYDGAVETHKALNTLLQGAGAVVMKAAQVMLSRWLKAEGIPAWFINSIHDEMQLETYPSYRFRVAQLAEESIRWAGRHFNLNVPLDAEAKVGVHWGDCH
jgi:hypothetical protein